MNTLADLIEKAEINYMIDRMIAIQQREGNPEGIEIRRFGSAVAFYSKTMPWGLFNNVKGYLQEDVIDDIIQFYNERDRKFEFQIIPSKVNPPVLAMLHQRSFYQSGFHTSLFAEPRAVELKEQPNIYIRELKEEEFETYARVHCLGTGLSLSGQSAVAANNHVLFQREGWRYYIAYYYDQPAAVAVMHIEDQLASLTFATTLPEYRRMGLQSQLLQARINEAYHRGCRLVVGQCTYGSASHRNMERVGMKIGYTRATWTIALE